jgi:hypothetical protein
MNAASDLVTSHVILELIGPDGASPVEAVLRYDPVDPYAVAVVFLRDGAEVAWVFGRDLLMRGLYEPAGDGDVAVFPSLDVDGRAMVVMELVSPAGHAVVEAQARDLLFFLARTTRAVWPGTEGEHLGLDAAITALLVGD